MNESAPLALSYFERIKQVRLGKAAERLGVLGVALAIASFAGAATAEAGQAKNMSREAASPPVFIDEAFWVEGVSCRTDLIDRNGTYTIWRSNLGNTINLYDGPYC